LNKRDVVTQHAPAAGEERARLLIEPNESALCRSAALNQSPRVECGKCEARAVYIREGIGVRKRAQHEKRGTQMEPRRLDGTTVLREAQEWFEELPTAGRGRRLEFARWIKCSPGHLKAYLLLTSVETELAGIRDSNELDLESVLWRLRRQ